jgi:hypothetical protein
MLRQMRRTRLKIVLALCVALLGAVAAEAQFRGRFNPRPASEDDYDGSFHFCRAFFRSGFGGDGGSWAADYPWADINLSIRLGELTKTTVSHDQAGDPQPLIVRLTDPALFQCGFVMMTEVGTINISDEEAANLRQYLLKGGFLWADDFWGSYAWENWASEFSKVLPPNQYPMRDLPRDHPLFRTQFNVDHVPQIPSINFWYGTGGTSEQGADSATPHALGVTDSKGRMLALVTFNTDLGDSWEREGDDKQYFYTFSVNGYAFGINTLLYAMTH